MAARLRPGLPTARLRFRMFAANVEHDKAILRTSVERIMLALAWALPKELIKPG